MGENLFGRVKRLVSGAINGGVDAMETAMPETTMREAIREIDRVIDEVRNEMNKSNSELHIAGRRIRLSKEKIAELQAKIETALNSDREDLAKAGIERQMDLEAQIPVLEEAQAEASKKIAELNSYVAALQGRKAEMEAELDVFKLAQAQADIESSEVHGGLKTSQTREKSVEKAEQTFDRVIKNASGVDAVGRSDRETMAKLVELEAVERQNKVEDRLNAFRKDMADKKETTY